MTRKPEWSMILRVGTVLVALGAGAHAIDITLDKNGYEPVAGGQVTGTGLPAPIPIRVDAKPLLLPGLQSNGVYSVDFFHNAGLGGSDFTFTINAEGTGIDSVSSGGTTFVVVKDFAPGATNLVLNTFPVTFNANRTMSYYYVGGLIAYGSVTNSEPITRPALPGWYRVDNVFNSGEGNEDFSFVVKPDGTVAPDTGRFVHKDYVPGASNEGYAFLMNADGTGSWVFTNAPNYEEYARFEGSQVYPRACHIHFRVESSTNNPAPFTYTWQPLLHPTNYVRPAGDLPFVYEFDVVLPPGNSGKPFNELGSNTVVRSNVMQPAAGSIHTPGPPLEGTSSPGDFYFRPRLRHGVPVGSVSTNAAFYWQGTSGASNVAFAVVEGVFDDGTPVKMSVTATIGEEVR